MSRNNTFNTWVFLKDVPMHIAHAIGVIGSFMYPLKLSIYLKKVGSKFYTGWLQKNFKHCGKNATIEYPVRAMGLRYISIGDNFISGARLRLEAHHRFFDEQHNPTIIIGNNVNINFDCHIGCVNQIQIGDNVLIASKVLIIDHLHGDNSLSQIYLPPIQRPLVSKGGITIGNNVWIGEGCIVLPGVTIGHNSIVGANSVVSKSFPDNAIIAGNPAQIIRMLE